LSGISWHEIYLNEGAVYKWCLCWKFLSCVLHALRLFNDYLEGWQENNVCRNQFFVLFTTTSHLETMSFVNSFYAFLYTMWYFWWITSSFPCKFKISSEFVGFQTHNRRRLLQTAYKSKPSTEGNTILQSNVAGKKMS
jgi:hypothetical protein